jgi:hypothetical protein
MSNQEAIEEIKSRISTTEYVGHILREGVRYRCTYYFVRKM